MKIAYIHGFQSSSNAKKATILKKELSLHYPDISFESLDFPDDIRQALDVLSKFVESEIKSCEKLYLVGSSMGGFFSLILQLKYDLKIALVNPCIYPSEFCLKNKLVNIPLKNFDTNNEFVITDSDIALLQELEEKIKSYNREKTYVLLQRADEVLDYKKAEQFFKDTKVSIEDGGSHSYDNFERVIPAIVNFFK